MKVTILVKVDGDGSVTNDTEGGIGEEKEAECDNENAKDKEADDENLADQGDEVEVNIV